MPVFLTMMAGMLFRRMGLMDENFAAKMNSFVFRVALPFNLFVQLYPVNFSEAWDTAFVGFCFIATALSIAIAYGIGRLLISPELRGEFVQASYRSSASLLGMAFIQNMYRNAAMGSLMMLGSVPLYNIAAVVILTLMKPTQTGEKNRLSAEVLRKSLIGILKNPLIIAIFAGCLWSLLRIPMPQVLGKTCSNIAQTATPMGLMAMGAALEPDKIRGRIAPAALASGLKLFAFCAIFTPLAVLMGFRREKLIAILVMLGSATTFAGYVMAKNMGHEGVLSQAAVMLTTLFAAFSLTLFIWLFRCLGYV